METRLADLAMHTNGTNHFQGRWNNAHITYSSQADSLRTLQSRSRVLAWKSQSAGTYATRNRALQKVTRPLLTTSCPYNFYIVGPHPLIFIPAKIRKSYTTLFRFRSASLSALEIRSRVKGICVHLHMKIFLLVSASPRPRSPAPRCCSPSPGAAPRPH